MPPVKRPPLRRQTQRQHAMITDDCMISPGGDASNAPISPGWTSGRGELFKTPKTISPNRRITRSRRSITTISSSLFEDDDDDEITFKKPPAMRMGKSQKKKVASPVMTRSRRRASVYVTKNPQGEQAVLIGSVVAIKTSPNNTKAPVVKQDSKTKVSKVQTQKRIEKKVVKKTLPVTDVPTLKTRTIKVNTSMSRNKSPEVKTQSKASPPGSKKVVAKEITNLSSKLHTQKKQEKLVSSGKKPKNEKKVPTTDLPKLKMEEASTNQGSGVLKSVPKIKIQPATPARKADLASPSVTKSLSEFHAVKITRDEGTPAHSVSSPQLLYQTPTAESIKKRSEDLHVKTVSQKKISKKAAKLLGEEFSQQQLDTAVSTSTPSVKKRKLESSPQQNEEQKRAKENLTADETDYLDKSDLSVDVQDGEDSVQERGWCTIL